MFSIKKAIDNPLLIKTKHNGYVKLCFVSPGERVLSHSIAIVLQYSQERCDVLDSRLPANSDCTESYYNVGESQAGIDILVPALPESVVDATVATWHVGEGDKVFKGQVLVDVETDKVVLEVPAESDGIVGKILCLEGTTVLGQQKMAELVTEVPLKNVNKQIKIDPVSNFNNSPKIRKDKQNIDIFVPVLPESVADATVATWHVNEGDEVFKDQVLVDVETDKVVLEVPAKSDGIIGKILHDEGDKVLGQQKLGELISS